MITDPQFFFCRSHGEEEGRTGPVYLICPTCNHVFPTAAILLAQYNHIMYSLGLNQVADQEGIRYCPQCFSSF